MFTGPNIVTNGLVLHLDAANTKSYTSGSSTWYDRSGKGAHGTLLNGVSWNSSGWFEFDGVDDGIDGINMPQNYVDLMIGMHLVNIGGVQMVFSKFNDLDKSFRTVDGIFRYTGLDINDWNYQNAQYNFANGNFLTGNLNITNNWNIVRLVNQNTSFTPPFVYSLSSDFLGRRYKGRIAFVLCYDRILSTQEVQQNYNATKSRFNL
jgi:hypothetical protein